jgi:APA family basic amino acid/polyamine antiporter
LARRLGLGDAVVLGLGSMLGPGLGFPGRLGVRGRQDRQLCGDGAHLRRLHLAGPSRHARIATLGEEVRDPARTIPLELGTVVASYALVGTPALAAVGPEVLATATAPLAAATESGALGCLTPSVRIGGAVASAGVLLSLMAGVGRTTLAMARDRELPHALAGVHPRYQVPHRAELLLGALVVGIVAVADVRGAIGFSSFAILTCYAIANAAAFTLPGPGRRWLRLLTVLGATGCVVLALTLPTATVLTGAAVLALGLLARSVRAAWTV